MPFLNDPSRILCTNSLQNKTLQGGFTRSNSSLNNTNSKTETNNTNSTSEITNNKNIRIMTYHFTADTKFNVNYHSKIVDSILQEESRWNSVNVRFVPFWESSLINNYPKINKRLPDVKIHLSNENTIKKKCGFEGLSCATVGGHEIYLNETNWTKGSIKSKLSLENYRKYVLTHEMLHILGYLHEECSGKGQKISIMQQQTVGIGDCVPFDGNLYFNSSNPPKISTQWD